MSLDDDIRFSGIIDLSDPKKHAEYMKALTPWTEKVIATEKSGISFYGVLEYVEPKSVKA